MHIDKSFQKRNYLESIDMFGIDISIRFCKQILHKTSTGGIFTILVFGIILFQIVLIVQQFIDKTNPQVVYQQSFTNLPQRYNLTRDVFSFAFGLMDQKSINYMDEGVYRVSMQLRVQERVFNATKNSYDLIQNDRYVKINKCTKEHFINPQTLDYFQQLDYNSLYCIDESEKDMYIEGQFDGPKYTRILIMIDQCQNSTTSTQVCKPQEYIDKKLTNNRLNLYYDDYSVLSRNRDFPFQAIGKLTGWISGPTLYKNTNLSLKNSYVYTDVGIMVQDIQEQRIIVYSSDKESTTPRTSSRLYDCYISHEKNVFQEYHRSYMKIDKALSQIGGIYNLLFTLGCLLCKPLSQVELNRKLLNSLFSFVNTDDDDNENNNNKNENKSLSKKLQVQQQSAYTQQQQEAPNFNIENNSLINRQLTKIDTSFNNTSNLQGDLPQLQQRQSNKLQQIDQKHMFAKYQNHSTNNSQIKENKNYSFHKDRNCNIFDQKQDNDDLQTNNQGNIGFSLAKQQSQQYNEDGSKNQQSQSMGKSTIFNLFRRKNTFVQNNEIFKKIHSIQQLFNNSLKEVKFQFIEFFISSVNILKCLRRRRHRVIKYGLEKLYQHIDIFYITTKLIELEKLKSLLLNEQQLKMFEFIPRPVLKFSDKGKGDIQEFNGIKEDNQDWYDKMIEAQSELKNLINKGSAISYIDKRLVEILYPKFQSINVSQINDTPKENTNQIETNPQDWINNVENEEMNEITIDRNQVKQSIQIQEKDFKNINQSINKITD